MAAVTATATATAGGTKDGRENFVLCNGELGTIVYVLCVRERYISRERKAEIEKKGRIEELLRHTTVGLRKLKSNIKR